MIAAMRSRTAKRNRRRVRDPCKALAVGIVKTLNLDNQTLNRLYACFLGDIAGARAAVTVLEKSWCELGLALEKARETAAWAYNDDAAARLSLDDLAAMLDRDCDQVREGLFRGLDKRVLGVVFRARGAACPMCGRKAINAPGP